MNWKRYLLPSALILAFGLTLGIAQTINKSVQLSQDPTGPVGFDTNNNEFNCTCLFLRGCTSWPSELF